MTVADPSGRHLAEIQGELGMTQHSVAATADRCRGRIGYTLDVLYSAAPSRVPLVLRVVLERTLKYSW